MRRYRGASQYPVFVFPSQYADPRGNADGSYIHWISVIDPARRTEMIMQGIAAVHHYEGRGLKAALERREGLAQPAIGRVSVLSDTMWVDAPIEMAREMLSDRTPLSEWAPLFRTVDAAAGSWVDEYARRVQVEFTPCELGDYSLIEQDFHYPDLNAVQRCPIVLVPSARAFGPDAPDSCSTGSPSSAATARRHAAAPRRRADRGKHGDQAAARGARATWPAARGMSYRPDPPPP